MVRELVRFTLAQKVFVNLLFILMMVVGTFCVFDLSVERYPDVRMGKVIISGFLPGASPDEVETLVTRKIEESLEDLENVEFIRSRSFRQRASVLVKFLDDTDYDALYDELRFRVLSIQNDLPDDMDPPAFTVISMSEWLPAISVNLTGDRSNRSLTLMAEEMKIPLQRIAGVKEVEIEGEFEREFHVSLDPQRLMRLGVTFDEVGKALEGANFSVPAGDFVSDSGEYVIVVDEKFRARDAIAKTIIRSDLDGSFVTVGDVMSSAGMDYRDPFVVSSVNGKDSVAIKIIKTPEGNALDIGAEVEKVVEAFRPVLEKEGVEPVLTQDQRTYINENINTLGSNLLVGIVLVCICIWIVMGFRNAMLTTVGVPFAFLVTMIIMWLTNNSLNEITLFSFVLVSGIIVDDAIVVVENIYRHVQEGKPLKEAVVAGTSEVFLPVIAATSTTVAAFLPMLIMSGSTGEFFALVPKAVSFAIAASIIECLFILPLHFLDWPGADKLKAEAKAHHGADPKFLVWLRHTTDRVVQVFLRHQWKSLTVVFGCFILAVVMLGVSVSGVMPLLRIKFFPDEYSLFYVSMEGPVGTDVYTSSEKAKEVSRMMTGFGPGTTKTASAFAGMDINDDYETVFGANRAIVIVELPAKEHQEFIDNPSNDPQLLLDTVREKTRKLETGGWTMRIWPEKGGPPAGKDVNIRVLGPDQDSVYALQEDVQNWVMGNESIAPYLLDFAPDTGSDNRVFRFSPVPSLVSEYGLTPAQVIALAGGILDGRFVGKFRAADEDIDLRMKIDKAYLSQPEDALDIPVLEDHEGPVRVGDLVEVESYREPGQLNRFQGQRAVTLTANIRAGSPITAPTVVHDVQAYYETIQDKYPGATISFAGEFESTGRSFTSLMYAFLIAILIIYTILACQFQSYAQPVIILSAVAFALTGVVFGTFLTRSLFTVNSFVATVGVTGVVVNDSLVLLDFINRLYASGLSRTEAIREGVRIRLRPILLTTLTTTLGLLPMALGIPYYSLVWGTMATTFVTGLCVATTLTLFIMPIEWDLLMRHKERKEAKRAKKLGLDQADAGL
ncbi:Cobalt-zinc-cadmium resistance protein CzcA [Pseudodesulfovibrio profundus]|uniref:Cobalt-zinc-cadmium resistance protein CzcA n=1 Tax=Pseudodesulfovibrio profundus TaxID=57320 RepID=A0A2C8F9N9_9BACT|nr:efflux RND transporter permease subunit [Pseudodesulfovibrio profundus]SOB58863.1 Cobalt-zinc-cadmium resistance protein CzcA [Pseudodesulfovibrio profundus]